MKLLLLFLLLELSLFASIGKISALNGKVVVDRNKQFLEAIVGFNLEEKDIISTDDKSKVQIIMDDGTVLSLGKNSKLNIHEYLFDENNQSNVKAEFKFVEGTFKSITGAIGKIAPEKFKLETKSATIGIRGTIVVGNQERVACTQGQITVTSAGVTQVLGAGMMTNTEIGKPPTAPTKIEGNILNEVSDTLTSKNSSSTEVSNSQSSENSTSSETNLNNQLSNSSQQNSNPTTQTSTLSNSFSELTTSVLDKVAQNIVTQQIDKEVNNSTATSSLIYLPFYSTTAILKYKDNNGEGFTMEDTITFSVLTDRTTVTIATYAPTGNINPYISLRKITSDNSSEYFYNNDSWTIANSDYNAILTQTLQSGIYELKVLNINNDPDSNKIELYITGNSSLDFTNNVTTYGYIDSIKNLAYISSPSVYSNHASIENNEKFKILVDSKVGTTISTDYGYFVTISDNFDSINYESINSENNESLSSNTPPTNVFLNEKENLDGSSWGYWATALNTNSIDMKSTWISGNQVIPEKLSTTFNGQVIGSVSHTDGSTGNIILDNNNVFKATIDIGAAKITNSLIKFTDTLSNTWSGTFNTTGASNVNQQGFSASITGTDTTGSLSGKYYGTNGVVQSIGGEFNMVNGNVTANGVFKAR